MKLGVVFIGLLITFVSAQRKPKVPKLTDSWEIDASCDEGGKRQRLETAFSDVVELIRKARADLAIIQQPQPPPRKTEVSRENTLKWNRIAKRIVGVFGIGPTEEIKKKGYDPTEENFKRVVDTFDRMHQGLIEGKIIPEKGFSGTLDFLHKKPLIMCGDTKWKLYKKDDQDPNIKGKTVLEAFPEIEDYTWGGAFIHGKRYLKAGRDKDTKEIWTSPRICRTGTYGNTYQPQDLITFCDFGFSFSNEKSPVRDADQIVENTDIDIGNYGMNTLTRVMIHEFAHYYGSRLEENKLVRVKDLQAVDANGCLLWQIKVGGKDKFTRDKNDGGIKRVEQVVYGFKFATNIAKDLSGEPHVGQWRKSRGPDVWVDGERGDTGPSAATQTAETYAYFGIISYLDKWDWFDKAGKAQDPAEVEARERERQQDGN
ncbi:hypothetical protein F53441_13257 [Fusarium austroafricanum]|uniref:Lysine-specific metallo-endopeptidase domain-containing protein n=1 Tax=Fusarium austroafricanum TaxID=2364996 RepID=A0A8H4JRY8_9HYPO|nr:hypothetical protein F53441_13257 [Fusarium austroafricanum]